MEDLSRNVSLLELLSVPGQNSVTVQEAIEKGADVNETSSRGFTPLMFAAILNDDPGVVEVLLENGANVNGETHDGMTALMWSLLTETYDHTAPNLPEVLKREENRRNAAMKLICHDADVNAVCYSSHREKWTPLLFATLDPDRNASLISALLAAGASVNVRTAEGVTPLIHTAAYGRSSDVVRELISAGADVNAGSRQEGRKGWTPLFYALASPYRNLGIVRELVSSRAEVDILMPNGTTPLFLAVTFEDDPAFAELLLDAGADPSRRDREGNSPLDCARAKNYVRIANLLLKAENIRKNKAMKIALTY
ncbi:MAG: ankyrin repeat domain-containing protein [Synergistaceae bacterium]|nr:ankyrin repeat domain-containing protein [Synergistaceae bacterium]